MSSQTKTALGAQQIRPASQPGFAALFTPKLITILREGYSARDLWADTLAGLTVAVVALPLSMAIAIASGAPPERGLYASIVGGVFVSLLGGSRFQVGGPAGAFIVLVAACVLRHGLEGMALAVVISGLILVCGGFLRLGTYIKFIPYPVTVGFTAGIAVIIFFSQIGDLFGLQFHGPQATGLLSQVQAIVGAFPQTNLTAVAVGAATIAMIVGVERFRPHWPAFLIALAIATVAAAIFHLPVDTIGTHFGGIPAALPAPALPVHTWAQIPPILPDAFAFALLGSIESLLSATIADGMTGRRHRSNCELVAQGVANIFSGLFGGLPVTGLIARTATNIRAGARGPVAGLIHSLFVLIFVVVAAPLARFIPLAALAGILAVVAWNMIERHAFAVLLTVSRSDASVLLATFLLTIFRDVTTGILVGFGMGTLLFLNRMAHAVGIEDVPLAAEDKPDMAAGERTPYNPELSQDPSHVVYRISGAFFFGAASSVAAILDQISERPKTFILDFQAVPFLDSTAAVTIRGFARKAARTGVDLIITGASPHVREVMAAYEIEPPQVSFKATIRDALEAAA